MHGNRPIREEYPHDGAKRYEVYRLLLLGQCLIYNAVIFIQSAARRSGSPMNPSSPNSATNRGLHPPPEDDDIFAFIRHLIPSPSPELLQAQDRSRVISPSPERDAPVSSSSGGLDVVNAMIDIVSPDASPQSAPSLQTHSPRL
jgi:hypothetical protein